LPRRRAGLTIAFVIRALALAALFSAGCILTDGPDSTVAACANLCDCVASASPLQEDVCNSDCSTQLPDDMIPAECLTCVARASCDELDDLSTACAAECGVQARGLLVEVLE